MPHLLQVKDLHTFFKTEDGIVRAVNGISYTLEEGESLAIVGESGSGKTVGMLSLMGLYASDPNVMELGEVIFKGRDLHELSKEERRKIRGKEVALVFQNPMTSLNPVLNIGLQVAEALEEHQGLTYKAALKRAEEFLSLVGIPNAEDRLNDYPHQFSGGQRQRIGIAMALACEPSLLIADEPTTALDVTVQAQIMELVTKLQKQFGMAIIWITHDLGVVAGLVDKVAVMYAGHLMEVAGVKQLYQTPSHPYTLGLLNSIPSIEVREKRLSPIPGSPPDLLKESLGCPFSSRCEYVIDRCREEKPPLSPTKNGQFSACWKWEEIQKQGTRVKVEGVEKKGDDSFSTAEVLLDVRDLKKHFPVRRGIFKRQVGSIYAVDGISFQIKKGETLGLVGESGCGKSTTGQAILRLLEPTAGQVFLKGQEITRLKREELRKARRNMQMIFQDPFASLNSRHTVGRIIEEGIKIHKTEDRASRKDRVMELLKIVGLNPNFVNRYPHEFSGGQRQRIGIARALATNPDFIVADEAISALDVSIQAQVVNLLSDLKQELGLTYLFIAHDLSMIRYISDRVAVMYLGKIVEIAEVENIFRSPLHPYTQALLSAIPIPNPETEAERKRIILEGDVPNPASPPSGCGFHTRCSFATDLCRQETPEFRNFSSKENPHWAACHHAKK